MWLFSTVLGEGNIGTPKHTPSAAENVSKATVEKYKSQLEKLTEENEEVFCAVYILYTVHMFIYPYWINRMIYCIAFCKL